MLPDVVARRSRSSQRAEDSTGVQKDGGHAEDDVGGTGSGVVGSTEDRGTAELCAGHRIGIETATLLFAVHDGWQVVEERTAEDQKHRGGQRVQENGPDEPAEERDRFPVGSGKRARGAQVRADQAR